MTAAAKLESTWPRLLSETCVVKTCDSSGLADALRAHVVGLPSTAGHQNLSGESNRPLTAIFLKSIAIHLPFLSRYFLQKYALLLAGSSMYTTNLHHDTPPICIAILLQKY